MEAVTIKKVELCLRCGKPCRPGETKNPSAMPLRKAKRGFCANCAISHFIRGVETLMYGIEKNGASVLLDPRAQDLMGKVFAAGNSEASISEIDWKWVVENWDMPFPKRVPKK